MKYNRIRAVIAMLLCVLLVGCVDYPLTSEEQENMVAEYAGGVLLRYSSKYALRLVSNDIDEDGVEDGGSVSGAAADVSEPEETAEPDKPEETKKPDSAESTDSPDDSGKETAEPTEEPTVSLTELYDIPGLDFSYQSSKFTNRYPEGGDDSVAITPERGQVLYVVSFRIKNTSGKTKKVNLTNRAFHYELDIGGERVLPSISLLPNGGLNYLMTKIKPGETEEAVLIFNLDADKKGSKGNVLTITEGDKSASINL
ncbi:MAG: hypothetical protein IKQ97_06195 [Eubacterium sp.]|nr:hypothetical protein [Eubacterium sp.]